MIFVMLFRHMSKTLFMMKINNWLQISKSQLEASGNTSSRLDCLILLELILKKDRSMILSHLEDEITQEQQAELKVLLTRRIQHEPIAYIRGYSEFYGRNFFVSPMVLIPRPESEDIITMLKTLDLPKKPNIADVGTGSGALAISASIELPLATVDAYDISESALHIARKNATSLGAVVHFTKQDLLSRPLALYDVVIANLPYVSKEQTISPDTKHEPAIALFSDDDGLAHIKRLFTQLNDAVVSKDGYLLIEAEPRQHERIISNGLNHGFKITKIEGFILLFQKS